MISSSCGLHRCGLIICFCSSVRVCTDIRFLELEKGWAGEVDWGEGGDVVDITVLFSQVYIVVLSKRKVKLSS